MNKKLISVIIPCYNEEDNVEKMYFALKGIFEEINLYDREIIFIDNNSSDRTVTILKDLAQKDKSLKIIINAKNFGHIRSPYYGLLQGTGDAIILLAADFQDPPEMIKVFLENWEKNYKIVVGIKNESKENKFMFWLRKAFYGLLAQISESEQIQNFTGFGLYDRKFIDVIKNFNDPYPYFRGQVAEFGFNKLEIPFIQPIREKGKTKNNFYTLYDMAMLGFINHSKLPLRLASFIGFSVAILSIIIATIYLIYKLFFWNKFQVGIAPLVIGIFFFSGVQLFFLGVIGEYIGAIFTQVKRRPLVIEEERINF